MTVDSTSSARSGFPCRLLSNVLQPICGRVASVTEKIELAWSATDLRPVLKLLKRREEGRQLWDFFLLSTQSRNLLYMTSGQIISCRPQNCHLMVPFCHYCPGLHLVCDLEARDAPHPSSLPPGVYFFSFYETQLIFFFL